MATGYRHAANPEPDASRTAAAMPAAMNFLERWALAAGSRFTAGSGSRFVVADGSAFEHWTDSLSATRPSVLASATATLIYRLYSSTFGDMLDLWRLDLERFDGRRLYLERLKPSATERWTTRPSVAQRRRDPTRSGRSVVFPTSLASWIRPLASAWGTAPAAASRLGLDRPGRATFPPRSLVLHQERLETEEACDFVHVVAHSVELLVAASIAHANESRASSCRACDSQERRPAGIGSPSRRSALAQAAPTPDSGIRDTHCRSIVVRGFKRQRDDTDLRDVRALIAARQQRREGHAVLLPGPLRRESQLLDCGPAHAATATTTSRPSGVTMSRSAASAPCATSGAY